MTSPSLSMSSAFKATLSNPPCLEAFHQFCSEVPSFHHTSPVFLLVFTLVFSSTCRGIVLPPGLSRFSFFCQFRFYSFSVAAIFQALREPISNVQEYSDENLTFYLAVREFEKLKTEKALPPFLSFSRSLLILHFLSISPALWCCLIHIFSEPSGNIRESCTDF